MAYGSLAIDTLNASTGILATQNGMTGIAKAWVSFTGSTGTIRASFNVSSITRNTTGDYNINFTNAFADANYSAVASSSGNSNGAPSMPMLYSSSAGTTVAPTTSGFRFRTALYNYASYQDFDYVNVAVFSS